MQFDLDGEDYKLTKEDSGCKIYFHKPTKLYVLMHTALNYQLVLGNEGEAEGLLKEFVEIKIKTPNEFYQMEPIKTSYKLYGIDDHLEELYTEDGYIPDLEQSRILIKYYMYERIDHRRVKIFGSIWFDNNPVMLFRNAGREGRDERSRFITNESLYWEMLDYIRSLLGYSKPGVRDVIPLDEPCPQLHVFYGDVIV